MNNPDQPATTTQQPSDTPTTASPASSETGLTGSQIKRRLVICTPREWRTEAMAFAARETGTEMGRRALVEANRYAAWQEEREYWQDRCAGLERRIKTLQDTAQIGQQAIKEAIDELRAQEAQVRRGEPT